MRSQEIAPLLKNKTISTIETNSEEVCISFIDGTIIAIRVKLPPGIAAPCQLDFIIKKSRR